MIKVLSNVGYDKGLSNGYNIQKAIIEIKILSIPADSRDDSIITLGFVSNSTNEYNQYLALFEESVKTIKVTNPGDITKSETYKKYKELVLQSNVKTMS